MAARYPFKRPTLAIEVTGGAKLGNCYRSTTYRVTAMPHRLKLEALHKLNDIGVLGFGQEFYVRSKCDGTEEPAGHDEVQCVEEDGTPAKRPDGRAFEPHRYPFFVYECESRCDSGD